MSCDEYREIISARLDGEERSGEWERAEAHLLGCASCAHYEAAARDLRRATRVVRSDVVPDLTGAILAAVGPSRSVTADAAERAETTRPLRVALGAIALLQVVLALPALVGSEPDANATHLARHLGAFDVALAVGFLVVALRPARFLAGALPVAVAAVVGMLGATLVDLGSGAGGATEMAHVTEVAGVCAMWLLGRTAPRTALA
ncbi:MAG TPA: zf-HC2 domain-containing protein [Acidimicrobiia bacterium]|nr:zf-HC2 domain-containing protein [Acidimicrobiia bacterium]